MERFISKNKIIIQPSGYGRGSGNMTSIYVGPYRVFPGRLSVSRTFGDIEAKYKIFGGLPNVVIAQPEINVFKFKNNMDFIVIGSDGIFDQLSNDDVAKCVWETVRRTEKGKQLHNTCGAAVDVILKTSLAKKSLDNVTCLMIGLPNLERIVPNESIDSSSQNQEKYSKLNQLKYDYASELNYKKAEDSKTHIPQYNYLEDIKQNRIDEPTIIHHKSSTPQYKHTPASKTSAYFFKQNIEKTKIFNTNYRDFTSFNGINNIKNIEIKNKYFDNPISSVGKPNLFGTRNQEEGNFSKFSKYY